MSLTRSMMFKTSMALKAVSLFLVLIFGGTMLAHAQVAPAAPQATAPAAQPFSSAPTDDAYVLGAGDVITAEVLGQIGRAHV